VLLRSEGIAGTATDTLVKGIDGCQSEIGAHGGVSQYWKLTTYTRSLDRFQPEAQFVGIDPVVPII
jgi:hypothetical protein